jgi:hypothetical protein
MTFVMGADDVYPMPGPDALTYIRDIRAKRQRAWAGMRSRSKKAGSA